MREIRTQLPALAWLLGLLLGSAGSAQAGVWYLLNGDRITGDLLMENEAFIEVRHEQLGIVRLPRASLRPLEPKPGATASADVGLAVPPDPEPIAKPTPPKWKRQVELGFVQQSGVNNKEDVSVRVQIDGREGANTFRATARLLQSEAAGRTVTDRREGDFRWRYDIDRRFFSQALTTYAEDEVRKIDINLEQQLGGGFRMMNTARHQATVGLGAVVRYLEWDGLADQTTVLGSIFQDYAFQWTSRLKLTQEANLLFTNATGVSLRSSGGPVAVDGNYRFKFNSGLQSKVNDHLSLNVRFEYDYDRSVIDSNLRTDERLSTSLGYLW
jgi:putative salt-induced outer membrane protein YdiY